MPLDRASNWLVTHQEPHPHIQTLGNPTSAVDLFRVVAMNSSGHEGWNSCYSDAESCIGLSGIIEGEIKSWKQVEAAEIEVLKRQLGRETVILATYPSGRDCAQRIWCKFLLLRNYLGGNFKSTWRFSRLDWREQE